MQLFNSVYIRSSLVCFFFIIANFHCSPDLETKISTDFTAYTVASLQRFFHWRTQITFGIAFKHPRSVFKVLMILDCRLLVTITFCSIKFRLLLYNMHAHISWCYNSSFVNISCQLLTQFVCLFVFFTLGFCSSAGQHIAIRWQ